jgi:hypothetical protein
MIRIDVDTRALTSKLAHSVLTIWASNAGAYDEWHREAAYGFQLLDDPTTGESLKVHLSAALAHWAERADRYESPHREAAEAFWTWYEG